MNDVVITAALRTAVGKFNGSIAKASSRQPSERQFTPRSNEGCDSHEKTRRLPCTENVSNSDWVCRNCAVVSLGCGSFR
jgi:hypothetical protein